MIFQTLYESAQKGELLLTVGGMARFHLRRDKQITIHEILILPEYQRQGIGRRLVERIIREHTDATCIVARCPADLPANAFYCALGFECMGVETLKSGRRLNTWRKSLP